MKDEHGSSEEAASNVRTTCMRNREGEEEKVEKLETEGKAGQVESVDWYVLV